MKKWQPRTLASLKSNLKEALEDFESKSYLVAKSQRNKVDSIVLSLKGLLDNQRINNPLVLAKKYRALLKDNEEWNIFYLNKRPIHYLYKNSEKYLMQNLNSAISYINGMSKQLSEKGIHEKDELISQQKEEIKTLKEEKQVLKTEKDKFVDMFEKLTNVTFELKNDNVKYKSIINKLEKRLDKLEEKQAQSNKKNDNTKESLLAKNPYMGQGITQNNSKSQNESGNNQSLDGDKKNQFNNSTNHFRK